MHLLGTIFSSDPWINRHLVLWLVFIQYDSSRVVHVGLI